MLKTNPEFRDWAELCRADVLFSTNFYNLVRRGRGRRISQPGAQDPVTLLLEVGARRSRCARLRLAGQNRPVASVQPGSLCGSHCNQILTAAITATRAKSIASTTLLPLASPVRRRLSAWPFWNPSFLTIGVDPLKSSFRKAVRVRKFPLLLARAAEAHAPQQVCGVAPEAVDLGFVQ